MSHHHQQHQLQTPEQVARELVQAVCVSFQALKEEQNDLFLEMGYTANERTHLSITLAEILYQSSLQGYPKKKLQTLISEGELQAMLYLLICGTSPDGMETQYARKLVQRPEIQAYAIRTDERREEESAGSDDVPSVSARDRIARRGALATRTGRDPRRTLRHHDLPLY